MPSRSCSIFKILALALIACALPIIGLFCATIEMMPANAAGEQSDAVNQGLTITPSSFLNCWICPATLTNTGKVGPIAWNAKAKGNGTKSISFNPSKGTLQPGKSVPLTITIEQVSCPASATFFFTTTTASWKCTPPPTPTPTPSPSPKPTPTQTPHPGTTPSPGSHNPTPTSTTGSVIPTVSPTPAQTPLPQGPVPAATATARANHTPTGSSQSIGGGPPTGGNSGGPSSGMMATYAALALALLAFLLYLIPQGHTPLLVKLLSLVLPSSVARHFGARMR